MPPPVIFLTGPIGVGKTTIGRALAAAPVPNNVSRLLAALAPFGVAVRR